MRLHTSRRARRPAARLSPCGLFRDLAQRAGLETWRREYSGGGGNILGLLSPVLLRPGGPGPPAWEYSGAAEPRVTATRGLPPDRSGHLIGPDSCRSSSGAGQCACPAWCSSAPSPPPARSRGYVQRGAEKGCASAAYGAPTHWAGRDRVHEGGWPVSVGQGRHIRVPPLPALVTAGVGPPARKHGGSRAQRRRCTSIAVHTIRNWRRAQRRPGGRRAAPARRCSKIAKSNNKRGRGSGGA